MHDEANANALKTILWSRKTVSRRIVNMFDDIKTTH